MDVLGLLGDWRKPETTLYSLWVQTEPNDPEYNDFQEEGQPILWVLSGPTMK